MLTGKIHCNPFIVFMIIVELTHSKAKLMEVFKKSNYNQKCCISRAFVIISLIVIINILVTTNVLYLFNLLITPITVSNITGFFFQIKKKHMP